MFENCKQKYREPEGGHLFHVVLGGDVCPGNIGSELAEAGRAADVMREISGFVRSADIGIVQWETPTVSEERPIPKSGPNLNSSADSVAIVRDAGFGVALLANNHIGDQGEAGVLKTLNLLHSNGLNTVGAGKNIDDATRPLILQAGGRSIALFNFAENEFGTATAEKPGSAPLSPIRNLDQTREAAEHADFVIVTLHGGHEHNPFPSPRLQELCRAFADAGADLVFNCHTHCPEGVEYYNGAQIVYSPGNLYFPSHETPLWNTGYLVKCGFDRRGVYELELLPYRFDREKVTSLDESERPMFERYLEQLCAPLSDPERLRRLFEAWSTRHGRGYLFSRLRGIPENWEDRLDDPDISGWLLGMRNIFTCESHHDMIRCYLRLIEEHRVAEAEGLLAEIKAFETPEWMK